MKTKTPKRHLTIRLPEEVMAEIGEIVNNSKTNTYGLLTTNAVIQMLITQALKERKRKR
jgi:hypothetical protein